VTSTATLRPQRFASCFAADGQYFHVLAFAGVRLTLPRCGPATTASLGNPASFADQPRLPVWALATTLLAHVVSFVACDSPFGLRPLRCPIAIRSRLPDLAQPGRSDRYKGMLVKNAALQRNRLNGAKVSVTKNRLSTGLCIGACLGIARGRDRGRFPTSRGGADAVGSRPNREGTTKDGGKAARSRRVGWESGVRRVAWLVRSTHYGQRHAPCIRPLSQPTRLTCNAETGSWDGGWKLCSAECHCVRRIEERP
jgi:hypothetical protein